MPKPNLGKLVVEEPAATFVLSDSGQDTRAGHDLSEGRGTRGLLPHVPDETRVAAESSILDRESFFSFRGVVYSVYMLLL